MNLTLQQATQNAQPAPREPVLKPARPGEELTAGELEYLRRMGIVIA